VVVSSFATKTDPAVKGESWANRLLDTLGYTEKSPGKLQALIDAAFKFMTSEIKLDPSIKFVPLALSTVLDCNDPAGWLLLFFVCAWILFPVFVFLFQITTTVWNLPSKEAQRWGADLQKSSRQSSNEKKKKKKKKKKKIHFWLITPCQ
jgi:DNA-binding helix-hairpin-helix protein with protein kinase domain